MAKYDHIGSNYASHRKPDPRIAAIIHSRLGDAITILNVGAGTGSYEPEDRHVLAVEPSTTMILQRSQQAASVIQAAAEDLPFSDKEFDLSLALLSLHHWDDAMKGLREMKRVSHRQLIFTWNPLHTGFWLTQDYFPEILAIDKENFPSIDSMEQILGPLERTPVPIPHDCSDGFGCAYWSRPEAYLSADVRSAISTFHRISNVDEGITQLKEDIDSGEWQNRYGHLSTLDSRDLGYLLLYSTLED